MDVHELNSDIQHTYLGWRHAEGREARTETPHKKYRGKWGGCRLWKSPTGGAGSFSSRVQSGRIANQGTKVIASGRGACWNCGWEGHRQPAPKWVTLVVLGQGPPACTGPGFPCPRCAQFLYTDCGALSALSRQFSFKGC